jgi:hypothetical protein
MINLNKLSVSTTKHNVQKLSILLKNFPTDDILKHLVTPDLKVKIDHVLAKKTLASYNGAIPTAWKKAKEISNKHADALLLISIIFSHHEHINLFKKGKSGNFKGTLHRPQYGTESEIKSYTNMARILTALDFKTSSDKTSVSYDFSSIFQLATLNILAIEIISIHLKIAGWNSKKKSFIDAIKIIKGNEIFSTSLKTLIFWFQNGYHEKEELSFFTEDQTVTNQSFEFKAGHTKKTEDITRSNQSKKNIQRKNTHNIIQNNLYDILIKKHGLSAVGTEVATANGTFIDLMLRLNNECTIYEIKTESSSKLCIRQAIPQLLEYAYWPDKSNADKLIITSQNKPCSDSIIYLQNLRSTFNIPVFYQQFDIEKNCLGEEL